MMEDRISLEGSLITLIMGKNLIQSLKNEFDFKKNRQNRQCLLGRQVSEGFSNKFNILLYKL